MSKKKRNRKEMRLVRQEAEEIIQESEAEVLDFLRGATPFEISSELSRVGVLTTWRNGIFALLDQHFMMHAKKLKEEDVPLPDGNDLPSARALAAKWESEAKSKLYAPDNEDPAWDLTFLKFAAIRFALEWSENRLEIVRGRMQEIQKE